MGAVRCAGLPKLENPDFCDVSASILRARIDGPWRQTPELGRVESARAKRFAAADAPQNVGRRAQISAATAVNVLLPIVADPQLIIPQLLVQSINYDPLDVIKSI